MVNGEAGRKGRLRLPGAHYCTRERLLLRGLGLRRRCFHCFEVFS